MMMLMHANDVFGTIAYIMKTPKPFAPQGLVF